jgi:putative component of membrane protein insertase Oxa1/YidC/SpoIIIJ protein YidD
VRKNRNRAMEKPQNKYEQEALIKYCINREIIRPRTNIFSAVKYVICLEVLTLLITFCVANLLVFIGFICNFSLLHLFVSILLILVFLKKITILFIELYQHYVPDQKRRKCTLKPSCSEYAIMALNKYGIFMAFKKIYIRLFRTCNGIYSTDYP